MKLGASRVLAMHSTVYALNVKWELFNTSIKKNQVYNGHSSPDLKLYEYMYMFFFKKKKTKPTCAYFTNEIGDFHFANDTWINV